MIDLTDEEKRELLGLDPGQPLLVPPGTQFHALLLDTEKMMVLCDFIVRDKEVRAWIPASEFPELCN